MDRRDFFKTMLCTSLLTPLLLRSETGPGSLELHLVAEEPELFISQILNELQKHNVIKGKSFAFIDSHPKEKPMRPLLLKNGWVEAPATTQAEMTFSFRFLQHKTLPSFALIKGGSVLDIRTNKLYSLWNEMNKNHSSSACLTIASFKNKPAFVHPGETVLVYKSGRVIDRISLSKPSTKSYAMKNGFITVQIKEGKARVIESSCRHKICVYSPPVFHSGDQIVCAPNHFLLKIQGPHPIDTVIG
ncbi:MAG: NusG domain II-containing protein [Candidatus Aminicenantes bacterium]|nr:NusG domain II-containing protein [Candidatus Aminicenantes bacterium]